ncbi:Phosphatidylinositol 4-kinase alpha [Acorus calamus]|uniref:Phosphatidylinositol 4-kinase alpha n=1 Tax=Acorus calamus TaxID=4465 RepID=A0AAV9EKD2_ACOCL|nr:Phosphatidylinositol 4-kinase alpha [Acorus calamus]
MDPLVELVDLIVQDPSQKHLSEKLTWICSRCPSSASPSAPLTHSHLKSILAVSRFLSKSPEPSDRALSSLSSFLLLLLPSSFLRPLWPLSFPLPSFFSDLLRYLSLAARISPSLVASLGPSFPDVVLSAAQALDSPDPDIARAFLIAASRDFPPVLGPEGAERLIESLFDRFVGNAVPSSPPVPSSASSSVQSSPFGGRRLVATSDDVVSEKGKEEVVDDASTAGGASSSSASVAGRSSLDQLGAHFDGGGASTVVKQHVAVFEEETVEGLERLEIAFRLFGHVIDGVPVRAALVEQVRNAAAKQIKSLLAFFKIRKREWTEHGATLVARVHAKLSACQAATWVMIKSLQSLESDGKTSKMLLRGTLALFIDAAEACIPSSWRKMSVCEELFCSLLNGIAQIAISRGGQLLRILLIRLKPLVLMMCSHADTWGSNRGPMFDAVTRTSCEIIEFGWSRDRAPVDTFIMGLASIFRERNDYEEQDVKEKPATPAGQLNVISLLADISLSVKKLEVVDMILPSFIESVEEGDASAPSLLRLRLLDAVARIASLGFEKSYRETVVLMTRSYLDKVKIVGSAESRTVAPEATTERVETLPSGFLLVASGLAGSKLRSDYRHRSGADFLGPLLPAVAEICSDVDPTSDVEPSLLKLFRNLWFYIVLFGLAPPILQEQLPSKLNSTALNSLGSLSGVAHQAVAGPYMWNSQWLEAVQGIAQGTPPLVVSSVKWLEDELELNALHNPGSRRGSGNEKAAVAQRQALCAALGGRVDVAAMGTISGVKATYLLAVSFLEIIRFRYNGGLLAGDGNLTASRSAFRCVFEYLGTPNLTPAVSQCLTATEERISETGKQAEIRESILSLHACFLIKNMSQRDERIRDISVGLLRQLRERFRQVLWNSSCLDSLLFPDYNESSSALLNDPAWVDPIRNLYQKVVQEWLTDALSDAPCTTQGLLQEKLCKRNTLQSCQVIDVASLLSEIRLGTGTTNIPVVMAAAAAASGASVRDYYSLEVLSTGMVTATVKSNHAGEIAGMRRLLDNIGITQTGTSLTGLGPKTMKSEAAPSQKHRSVNELLLDSYIQQLQKILNIAERGDLVDRSSFHDTCSKATALLLSNMGTDYRLNVEGFSQLLRLLCWCPAYILTPDAMETGVYIWTWLVAAAPHLGPLVLAELVDAWLWTMDTNCGLFACEMRYAGPSAKLRPHLKPGEPDVQPEKDPVVGIIAHKLWLGFFIDRFEVVRHGSVEQLLLLGRMLQGTMKSPLHFSHHPAAAGTFFTVMLLGLKFCSCQTQSNLQDYRTGLHLLEDRVYRASLGWFAYDPEWYDTNNKSFAQSEAQSVSAFVQHLIEERTGASQTASSVKGRKPVDESSFSNVLDQCHPVWGPMDNYSLGREKRKQLLLMLCQHEADRLEVWAQLLITKEGSRSKISSEKWIEYVRTAFDVDPRIALSLTSKFPTNSSVTAEVTQLVQYHKDNHIKFFKVS